MADTLLDRMAFALRAMRNAEKQGRPLPTGYQQLVTDCLQQYDLMRVQDEEDAAGVIRRITDPFNNPGAPPCDPPTSAD